MDQKVVQLKEPIKQGSVLISELTFKKPKAKDIRSLPAGNATTNDILNLAGRLCGQPPSVIDELSMEDTLEVLSVVGNFMQPGPQTGKAG